jgi:hypothetical protein
LKDEGSHSFPAQVSIHAAGPAVGLGADDRLLVRSVAAYLRAKKSAHWPAADGVITVSQLREGSFKGMKGYWGQIEFRYRVGNKEYQSSSLSLGREHLVARESWEPVLDEYPVGKSVKVHYDPRQPAVGILEPGLHGEMEQLYQMVLFFIGACSVGFVVVLLWYHDPEDV